MTDSAPQRQALMSHLADGELDSDQVNRLLLDVLDDPQDRGQLKDLLQMRHSLATWRHYSPQESVMLLHGRTTPRHRRLAWLAGGLATAAMFGGILVMAGFYLATRGNGQMALPPLTRSVTPEQIHRAASAFALRESVDGPLRWYASDEGQVELAAGQPQDTSNTPVAVVLRLSLGGHVAKKYLIVCREKEPAAIDLPAPIAEASALRVLLTPRAAGGTIELQYAIALAGSGGVQGTLAGLSGRRTVAMRPTPLGQLNAANLAIEVDAAAWTVRQEDLGGELPPGLAETTGAGL